MTFVVFSLCWNMEKEESEEKSEEKYNNKLSVYGDYNDFGINNDEF